uniref:Pentatricopeptide repeat-containing protein n=1 Tax=Populus trichocarpa TaxID=3694 RepID=A0A2K1Z916_POPTR
MHADAEMECARELFDEMHEKDVISWSVIIGVGLQMFKEIESDGVVTVSVLKACVSSRDICEGRLVIRRGFDGVLFVVNSLC